MGRHGWTDGWKNEKMMNIIKMTDHQRSESILSVSQLVDDEKVEDFGISQEDMTTTTPGDDVRVYARFRPLNDREKSLGDKESVYSFVPNSNNRTIEISRPTGSNNEKEFTFDEILPESTTQEELYLKTAKPLVTEVLKGFNCTMMAYGQTGSGKSYSMTGRLDDSNSEGIIPRMIHDLFAEIEERSDHAVFTIQCSYVEIYLERVRDLLNPQLDNLKLREVVSKKFSKSKKLKSVKSMVYIEGATICTVKSLKDMLKVMRRGDANRITAETDMNERSSRSHSVFVVTVTQIEKVKQTRRSSKLFLVDLAGSEQVDRSGATGLKLEQAKKINKSLSALSLVIQSLVEKKKGAHIPYRDSKLTRLLTDSLGGNSKTVLLLALSPSWDSLAETYSSLSFGSRAKKMVNRATVNEELTVGSYKKLVAALGKDIEAWKHKAEDADQKYQQIVLQYQALEQECVRLKTQNDASAEDDIKRWKLEMGLEMPSPTTLENLAPSGALSPPEKSKSADDIEEDDEEVVITTLDSQQDLVADTTDAGLHSAPSPPLLLEEMLMFQTGNLVVFDTDKMFTFEPF